MKFKVGDRVAVYDRERMVAVVVADKRDNPPGCIWVKFIGTNHEYPVHPKQCRHLKKKREQRRVWVNPAPTPGGKWEIPHNNFVSPSEPPNCGWAEFIEVIKK